MMFKSHGALQIFSDVHWILSNNLFASSAFYSLSSSCNQGMFLVIF